MKPYLPLIFLVCIGCATTIIAQSPKPLDRAVIDNYPPGLDSKPQAGVPKGKLFSFDFADSKIFPGTTRKITVYITAQYTEKKPACVYVGLDALGFRAPTVFDNLIHKGEMPVTIGIGVSPGQVASIRDGENPRFNRSFEFDGLNDSLAQFLLEEIFPEVENRKTPDGLPIKLSKSPNDRCAGGGSTGGIAAFTLAWERPDQFRRVFSGVGTFVGMRGGDRYPVIVRKTEPKPIRVFQQDGENDQWGGGPEVGDWWMSNVTLQRSLEFAGYDAQHIWGTGPHSSKHATAVFPDAMRFLWKDWPKPIKARVADSQNVMLKWILDPESKWEQVADAGKSCDSLVVNPAGELFFNDTKTGITKKLSLDGEISTAQGIPVEKTYAFDAEGKVITAEDINATCLIATHDGKRYATESAAGKVWFIKPDGNKTLLDEGLKNPTAIALSPDGLWLAVMEHDTHWGYSYRLKADGSTELKQRFYWAHLPDWADGSGARNMCMDRNGRPYVATHLGVQVFDRNGRSRGILPLPMPHCEADSISFGGEKFDTLFVISDGKLYRRQMKAVGAPAFIKPIKLPKWGKG